MISEPTGNMGGLAVICAHGDRSIFDVVPFAWISRVILGDDTTLSVFGSITSRITFQLPILNCDPRNTRSLPERI